MAEDFVAVKDANGATKFIRNQLIAGVDMQTVTLADSGGALLSLPAIVGTWDYRAGASGSPRAFTGRVVGITAHATTAGSFTINGGDSIPVPANTGVSFTPNAQLVSPTLVFTGTDGYVVELVS